MPTTSSTSSFEIRDSIRLTVLTLLSLFVFDRVAYSVLTRIDRETVTGQAVGKANFFLRIKDDLKLLVVGSSRANRHVDVGMMPQQPAFNMGQDGIQTLFSTTLARQMKRDGQTLLVHLDHSQLFDESYMGDDVLKLRNLYFQIVDVKQAIDSINPKNRVMPVLVKSSVYRNKVMGMIYNYLRPKHGADYNGFDPLFPTQNQRDIFQRAIRMLETQPPKAPEIRQVNAVVAACITKLAEHATKYNLRLVFFTSPVFLEVDSELTEATHAYMQSLGLTYLDCSEGVVDRELENWKDQTHLSSQGAATFTEHLIRRLDKTKP